MIMPLTQKISIVLSDVDGTLVDSKKRITERAKAAIQNLSAPESNSPWQARALRAQ
jgi:phosphoglycolate phosphatase-like HAD superfamily hydrolase